MLADSVLVLVWVRSYWVIQLVYRGPLGRR